MLKDGGEIMVTKADSRIATGFGKSQFHPSVMWKVWKRMTLELECNLNNQNVQVPEKKTKILMTFVF